MTTNKAPIKLYRMGTWSDSFLSSFQFWVGWVAIIGTALGLFSAVATLMARHESSGRQSAKELQRTARIQAAETALESTKMRLTEAQAEAKTARDLATKADAATKPRRLTTEQKEAIISALKVIPEKPKIFMLAGIFDAEAVNFGKDIEAVFKESGFEVYFPTEIHDDAALSLNTLGLHLVLKDVTVPNPTAAKIQKSFISIGIQIPGMRAAEEDFPADRIMISVGQKQ